MLSKLSLVYLFIGFIIVFCNALNFGVILCIFCVGRIFPLQDGTMTVRETSSLTVLSKFLFTLESNNIKVNSSWVLSYVKFLPEAGLALLAFSIQLLLCGLVQLPHSAVDIGCVHSGGVIRLERKRRTEYIFSRHERIVKEANLWVIVSICGLRIVTLTNIIRDEFLSSAAHRHS